MHYHAIARLGSRGLEIGTGNRLSVLCVSNVQAVTTEERQRQSQSQSGSVKEGRREREREGEGEGGGGGGGEGERERPEERQRVAKGTKGDRVISSQL